MSSTSGDTSAAPCDSERFSGQQPGEAARTIDWRFARVQALLAPQFGRQPRAARPTSEDDAYVRQMREYLLLLRTSPPTARQQLALRFPGPYGALQIREQIARELQLSVQCRILASQTDAQIARKTALAPVAIHWYEKLFFNVRDLLDAPDWVTANVLELESLQDLSPWEGALKRAAYLYGAEVFDTLQTGLRKRPDPEESADLENDLEEAALAGTRRQVALAAMDPANVSSQDVAQLVRQMQVLIAGKQALQGETSELINIHVNSIAKTLSNINFIKGDMAQDWLKKHNPNLLKYDSGTVELRDSHVYAVVSGNFDAVAHLQDRKFPPPPDRGTRAPVRADYDPLNDSTGPAP